MEIFAWFIIVAVSILIVLIVFTFLSHLFLQVPYVPTPSKVIHEMINIADLQGTETILDLGAGDARVLTIIKKKYPKVKAIGYEAAPTIWLLGKLRILFARQKVDWHVKNMFKADLKGVDYVFLYLFPGVMQKLGEKFDHELSPGTKVVSYAFSFPGRTPLKQVTVPWISGDRQLYLYEW